MQMRGVVGSTFISAMPGGPGASSDGGGELGRPARRKQQTTRGETKLSVAEREAVKQRLYAHATARPPRQKAPKTERPAQTSVRARARLDWQE